MKKTILLIVIGLSVIGVIGLIIAAILNPPTAITTSILTWAGIVGTIASVILSILAMYYSNKASNDAEESLKQITQQYKALCDGLMRYEIENGIGKKGATKIAEKYESMADSCKQ